jgi:hypothetical protein
MLALKWVPPPDAVPHSMSTSGCTSFIIFPDMSRDPAGT